MNQEPIGFLILEFEEGIKKNNNPKASHSK